MTSDVGIVVIGRNEGDRLGRCLESLKGLNQVVYVDSGSIDKSVALARLMKVDVVELTSEIPFTAARARNEGFARLIERAPGIEFVQFLDADCELAFDWLRHGKDCLERNSKTAMVCGRLLERNPEASIYNRLCEMEWEQPVGVVPSCGGIALVRASAFVRSAGFSETMIAGEEADLCFRLRQAGWLIVRLSNTMAVHDSAMFRAAQWWFRSKRSGYADMEAASRRGAEEPHLRRKVWSNVLWALPPAWLLWPVLWVKTYRRRGSLYATHIVLGKLPHFAGTCAYLFRGWRRQKPRLIEHK